MNVPSLEGPIADELKSKLYPGAAVGNPIDIIGTGTPEHLATAIDFCENRFDNVDLMMVIFGSPGLVKLMIPTRYFIKRWKSARSRSSRYYRLS